MDKLILNRIGMDVFVGTRKLTRVDQATKGPGNEQIKIENLPNSNGRKWISLSLLQEGINELTVTARDVTRHATTTKKYELTDSEKSTVDGLQRQIDAILDAAKSRYVPKPNLNVDPRNMTSEERRQKIEEIMKYFEVK